MNKKVSGKAIQARKKLSSSSGLSGDFESLVSSIIQIHQQTQNFATKAINVALTLRNWLIGQHIVEFEQKGRDRASYGEQLMDVLSQRLVSKGLSRTTPRELRRFRLFFQTYPKIWESATPKSLADTGLGDVASFLPPTYFSIRESVTPESQIVDSTTPQLIHQLSFTHLNELIQLPDETQRRFYEVECIRGNWSVLGLRAQETMGESDLEDALLDRLEELLLEMGHGFCFEARQKRLLIGDEHFFVDLVFYHRVLKCHVLVKLKTGEFSHEHLGQLNTYLAYYKKHQMTAGDQPPIGILLCTKKNEALVEFALGDLSNKVFVSRYAVEMPGKAKMEAFLKQIGKEIGHAG